MVGAANLPTNGCSTSYRRTKGGLNSKLSIVCDGEGRPIIVSEGRTSDCKGARLVIGALPPASDLIAECGYDGARFRTEPQAPGIKPSIPSSRSRNVPYD